MTLIGGKCEEGSTLMIVWGLQSSLWQAERIERANEKKRQGDNGRGNKKEGMKKRRKRMKRKASNQLDIIGGKDTDVALKLSFPPSAVFLFGESHNRPDIQSKISRVLRRVIVQNTSFGPRIFRRLFGFGRFGFDGRRTSCAARWSKSIRRGNGSSHRGNTASCCSRDHRRVVLGMRRDWGGGCRRRGGGGGSGSSKKAGRGCGFAHDCCRRCVGRGCG